MESILQVYRHFPWCMSNGFCIWFKLELVQFSWKFPNSGENVRIGFKDVLLCQWTTLKLLLCDWMFGGIVRQFSGTVPFIFWMKKWISNFWCLAGCHLWMSRTVWNVPQCNTAWAFLECNMHPLRVNLETCHNLWHKTIVCRSCPSTSETHGTFQALLLLNFLCFPSW